MHYEIITDERCESLARQLQLPDLVALAERRHAASCVDGCLWTPMAITRAFGFYRPDGPDGRGFGCVLFGFAGTGSPETDALEGMEVAFAPGEETEAAALLVRHAAQYDEQFIADDLAKRIRAADQTTT